MKAPNPLLIKTILGVLFFFLITASSFFSWQIWQNNRSISPTTSSDILNHFNQSVAWLNSNYSTIENIKNPILWWMIKQAASTSGDETLKNIYAKYKVHHLDTNPSNLSTPMFDKFYHPNVPDIAALANLHDYQIFFFYALSCDSDLASEPIIQKQLSADSCSLHYLHTRCITHQLMGLRFMQRYQCGYDEKVSATITQLQKIITSELTWDFRVGDAYIQRVLMLVDSGAYNNIKPIWVKSILDAQNEDGSWDDIDPVLYLGNDYFLAYTSQLPTIKKPEADFHTTAQAIWLLSLLLKETDTNQ